MDPINLLSHSELVTEINAAVLELDTLAAQNARLREAIKDAQRELRSTQYNWSEQCLFDCDNILNAALEGSK